MNDLEVTLNLLSLVVGLLSIAGTALILGVRHADALHWWWDGLLDTLHNTLLGFLQGTTWWQHHAIRQYQKHEQFHDDAYILEAYRKYLTGKRYQRLRKHATRLTTYVKQRVAELEGNCDGA